MVQYDVFDKLEDIATPFRLTRELHRIGSPAYMDKYGYDIKARLAAFQANTPAVDVAIAMRNEENYIPATLHALSLQTIPINPIIVDNHSTDSSVSIVKSMGLKVIDEPRIGIDPAKRAALLNTKTDQVLLTDADCAPVRTWAYTLLTCLQNHHDIQAIYSPVYFFDTSPSLILYNALSIAAKYAKDMLSNPHYQGNNCGLQASVRDMIRQSDSQIGDDGYVFKAINENGGRVSWLWQPDSWVATSARRVKTHGIAEMIIRRGIHLTTGNSDIAYYSLYSPNERAGKTDNSHSASSVTAPLDSNTI